MKIGEAIKACQYATIKMGNRWLTCGHPGFVVYEFVPDGPNKEIIRTADEDAAVKELIKGEPLYKDIHDKL